MLIAAIERYLALRRSLGFKLREASQRLQSFGRFAMSRGDTHVRTVTAIEWATAAPSPNARRVHLEDVVRLARFLRGEDPAHEVPPENFFHAPRVRPLPYIYSPEQIVQIVAVACEPPEKSGRPISHWSARELADEVKKRQIVKDISPRTVGRFLKTGRLTAAPQPLLAQRRPA